MNDYKFNTVSNYISILRIVLIIPLIISYLNGNFEEYAVFFMIIAYITDILDGYLARKLNQISEFGKFIDPLADKLFVITLVTIFYINDQISDFYFYLVIARDLIIFIGGIYVSKILNFILPSNIIGKVAVLFIGIYLLILSLDIQGLFRETFYNISILLIFISLFGYIYRAYETIKWKRKYEIF